MKIVFLAMNLAWLVLATSCDRSSAADQAESAVQRPNILWITSEDNGPELGCYGDQYATTPNIDQLATQGCRYLNAWSTAPVCAPARTTIITGMYAASLGAQNMRSRVALPKDFQLFPQILRAAGYYCTNNDKEDYNVIPNGKVWDESSRQAHWKNRPDGRPFFAVFNIKSSHESQIRKRPHTLVHDPAKVVVPPYHPDVPEVRRDWAQYYDILSIMDRKVGKLLQELAKAGLTDETIVFYYGDHGSGMPRSKRWLYRSGLRVPLLLSIPQKYQALMPPEYTTGGSSDRLVGFVDLAPTVLSLAGISPPQHWQGNAFAGAFTAPPARYLYGFRDRMDERFDLSRAVRDNAYHYIRNYFPSKPQGQYLAYMFETPTTRVWKAMFDEHKLNAVQSRFWQSKPSEELYDISADPFQIHNLAGDAKHAQELVRLRDANRAHLLRTRDVGFVPEAQLHLDCTKQSPYEFAQDRTAYPLEQVLSAAELASTELADLTVADSLADQIGDASPAVRFWAVQGILIRGQLAVNPHLPELRKLLADPSPNVQVSAAEALARLGSEQDKQASLELLIKLADPAKQQLAISMAALAVLDDLDEIACAVASRIPSQPIATNSANSPYAKYVNRLIDNIPQELGNCP